jgi:hypothetical protein
MKENGLTEKRFTALLAVVMICITSIILLIKTFIALTVDIST